MSQGEQLHAFSLKRVQNLFLLNGITALLGWNAVLGSLDYFNNIYPNYNVYLYFPIPCFIAYTVTGLMFNWLTLKVDYRTLVICGIVVTNFSLFLLLIISSTCKEKEDLGFWLSMVGTFIVGFFSNLAQLSFFGMINYYGSKTVSRFTIGTAASGLALIILRAIITIGFGGNDPGNIIPIIIYFSISCVYNFFDLFLNIQMFATQQYKQKIQKHIEEERKSHSTAPMSQSLVSNESNSIEQPQSQLKSMWEALKVALPYPLFIFFDFLITFMLFPNLTFAANTSLSQTWSTITFLMMYNIGDFAGKLAGDFRSFFNSRSIKFLFYSRLFFFYSIPLMTKSFTQEDHLLNNDVFPFFNQFLFAFTNGLVINGSFVLAFEVSPLKYKKFAGILCGILLQWGIMFGSFLAVPFQSIVKPDARPANILRLL